MSGEFAADTEVWDDEFLAAGTVFLSVEHKVYRCSSGDVNAGWVIAAPDDDALLLSAVGGGGRHCGSFRGSEKEERDEHDDRESDSSDEPLCGVHDAILEMKMNEDEGHW